MSPALSIRRPALLGLAAVLALVLGFGLWASGTEIAGAIVAPGQIQVERDRQIVQHPEGGVVAEILVTEGAAVSSGQVLLRLDGTALRSELAVVDGQLSELAAHAARLKAERDGLSSPAFPADLLAQAAQLPAVAEQIDGQRRLFLARAATLAEEEELLARRIEQTAAQAAGIDAQAAALHRQLDLVEEDLAAKEGLLRKGLVQAGMVLGLQREEARLAGQIGELRAERARIDGQVTEIGLQLSGLKTRRREDATTELRQIEPALLELAERRRALAARIDRLDIRAPVAEIVLGLQVTTPQAVLRPAEPVLYVIPQDRPLVIAARITPIQIDEIVPGQEAELVLPAFAARTTPHLRARVTRIAADALADPRSGIPFYTVELQLEPGERERLGTRPLVPGMPVDVFLQTGERTPLAYLLQPFATYFSRAFRES